ncbi:MAG: ABC transporter permease [Gemmatimonadaceae bacterium]|nr:ABC transporter permease [Gemmatimonadaceae bacterium]
MLRRSLRRLARAPGSSVAAIAAATIGIAISTMALAIADAALWRPLPFAGVNAVVVLSTRYTTPREGTVTARWSFPRLRHVREAARTVEHVTAWNPISLTLTGRAEPEVVAGEVVSRAYFALLGASPAMGRVFAPDEDVAGAPRPVVVLSAAFAQRLRRRGEDASLGGTITVNGHALTIVGIMPPRFRGLSGDAALWIPIVLAPVLTYPEYLTTPQDFITLLSRVRDGRSLDEVRREMAQLAVAAQRVQPTDEAAPDLTVSGWAESLGSARVRREARRAIPLVVTGGVLLFVLTLANLVALQLGRAVARRRETAVALAIGAPRRRLWLDHAADGVVLVSAAAIAALAAVVVALALLGPVDPIARLGRATLATHSAVTFDGRLIAWWCLTTVVALAVVGGIPAWWALRHASLDHLRDGARGAPASGLSRRRPGLAAAILVVEGALAMLLVTGAGQLLESYRRLQPVELGAEASHVLTFELQPSEVRIPPAAAPGFIDQVLDEVRRIPGVVAASVDGGAPLAGSARTGLHVVGRPDDARTGAPMVLRHYVGPEHFAALGIPLRAGRAFTPADRAGAPRVVIISQSSASAYFPAGDAIGQRVWFDGSTLTSPDSSAEIVGIVGDVTYDSPLGERTRASFYTPYAQFTYGWRVYFVRVQGEPRAFEREIRAAVGRVAPDLPLRNVRPLTEIVTSSRATSRVAAHASTLLAALALLLAACGTWAVVSHAIAQRRHDLAIRVAHGATRRRVVGLVLADGLWWPAVGLALGATAAVGSAGALRALLYGVAPGEPVIAMVRGIVFLAAATLACFIPAWSAARVDPMEVLRGE